MDRGFLISTEGMIIMATTYGRAKNDIRRARYHFKGVAARLDWIQKEYTDHPCIQQWFDIFKPFLGQADDSLQLLLSMLVDPKPYDDMMKGEKKS